LATGAVYYPLFLLPLWCGFYWSRGLVRFLAGVAASIVGLMAIFALMPGGVAEFGWQITAMFGWTAKDLNNARGLWGLVFQPAYRIPAQVAFFAMCIGLAIWPVKKNLGTLLSSTTAVMLATQFWQLDGGGTRIGWYLPLLVLTVFRPNLEDRIALSVLGEAWLLPKVQRLASKRAA
jgi:hypothetical protein